MNIEDKLAILAGAAKYDASCASSGSRRSNRGRRLGNAAPSGICHSYTEDGRCVSLLKILYTNKCIYDCAYCVNRRANDLPRAAFTSGEIVSLTIDFYRRNYIEGLFLSSGVIRSPDDTMERLIRTAKDLRRQGFNGYVHLKCVPFASRRLVRRAGLYADRLSVNIELPSEESLTALTAEKTYDSVLTPMGVIQETIAETRENRKRLRHTPAYAPAGQSTQLIIGASPESDYAVLDLADRLYRRRTLKRVYYSAYVPVLQADRRLPDIAEPPLRRENRLYQADWLMRLYGFSLQEVISRKAPYLDLAVDPKQAFAMRNPALFPVDVNTANREMLLRVPGIGLKSAYRIPALRRRSRIRFEHLKQIGVVVSRAVPYILCDGLPPMQWRGAMLTPHATEFGTHAVNAASADIAPTVFLTDGSFDGLLTAIFAAYRARRPPNAIAPKSGRQPDLFEQAVSISTDPATADRVWQGLKTRLGGKRSRALYDAHLSESAGIETAIYVYVRDTLPYRGRPQDPVDLTSHIQIETLAQKVRREAHRMKGFIRFHRTGENRYSALIAPRYDVLPLIRRHFEKRYADQTWIIYDTKRHYGLCRDQTTTREIRLKPADLERFGNDAIAEEQLCQRLWQRYWAAANISHRHNPTLHMRQLPRRFWRYLPEKRPAVRKPC
jgi:probable DNA metabolism protein